MAGSPSRPRLHSLEEISLLLQRALDSSPADETELVWLEILRGRVEAHGGKVEARQLPERTVLVRVLDRGRVGSYRAGVCELGELQNAVRMAIAQSRVREPLSGLPHLPGDESAPPSIQHLHDRQLEQLSSRKARSMLEGRLKQRESARFDWLEAGVVVFNSRSVRRSAAVTAAQIAVRSGERAGGGHAVAAARNLERLDLDSVISAARHRRGRGKPDALPEAPPPIVLAPEATIELVDLLSRVAFSAKAYYDGTSFLREHLGVQVFDRSLDLADDATDPRGIPFPFDLEGTAKRRVDLILKGAPKTPTLDQRQAAVLGLPPTAHAIGGNDSQALNLFLGAGEASEAELLRAAEGGLWIGSFDRIETLEPQRVQFRARARGVRRIRDGELAAPVVDLWWQDSLLRALSDLRGVGRDTACRLTPDGFLGGVSAPMIALGPVEGIT